MVVGISKRNDFIGVRSLKSIVLYRINEKVQKYPQQMKSPSTHLIPRRYNKI